MFCSGCGRQTEVGQQFCPACGRQVGSSQSVSMISTASTGTAPAPQPIVVVKTPKNPGVAAVLSFFWAGLGQIYNGEIGKGIVFMVLYFVSALLILAFIGIITTPILWIFGMVDAYRTAEKINMETGHPG